MMSLNEQASHSKKRTPTAILVAQDACGRAAKLMDNSDDGNDEEEDDDGHRHHHHH